MFYSPSTQGLYDAGAHGPLRIQVPDPAWVRPTKTITLPPGYSETIDGELYENTGDEPADFEVPDMAAFPNMIEVDNAATLIPADAIELTDEEYSAIVNGRALGQIVQLDNNQRPTLVNRPPPDPAAILLHSRLANARRYLAETDWLADLVDMGQEQHLPHDVQTARAAALAFIDANT
ncbi:MAG TPA: hypothetical protein VHQ92_11075 [Pseudolabrys sp.]|jgi:hypothetical protein|nr:hypothetical protein [Pseudolabrys sp.]